MIGAALVPTTRPRLDAACRDRSRLVAAGRVGFGHAARWVLPRERSVRGKSIGLGGLEHRVIEDADNRKRIAGDMGEQHVIGPHLAAWRRIEMEVMIAHYIQ